MSSFNTNASRAVRRARTTLLAACLIALAGLLMSVHAEAREEGSYGDAMLQRVQFRGPGFAEEPANERAMRQAARAQRQQQLQEQRAQQNDRRPDPVNQRAPEHERAAPQAPGYRPPEPGDSRIGRPGRLTPEERRALRQQIDEAGRDVYRPNSRP